MVKDATGDGEGVGVIVMVLMEGVITLILTQMGWSAESPTPKILPVVASNSQFPLYLPVVSGATRFIDRFTV